jgi:hypothetical protein
MITISVCANWLIDTRGAVKSSFQHAPSVPVGPLRPNFMILLAAVWLDATRGRCFRYALSKSM